MASAVADPQLEAALTAVESAVGALVALGASPVDVADAYTVIRRVEGVGRRVSALQTELVGQVEQRRLHVGDGHRSAKALVGFAAKLSGTEAGRRARAARALRDLPTVASGFAEGRIGVPQVDRIARVHANPRVRAQLADLDEQLAVVAERLHYDEFDRHLAEWERLADEDGAGDRAERDHRRRAFAIRQNLSGSWRMEGGCGSLQGAISAEIFEHYVRAELEADWAEARERVGDAAMADDLVRTDPQRRMDAFEQMCRDAADAVRTASGHQITTDLVVDQATFERYGRKAAGDDPGPDPRVRTYWEDLARTDADPAGSVGVRCTTIDGRHIDPAEALAAAWVGQVRRVVMGADDVVLNMGRRQRLFTGPRHLAVQLSRGHCYWPGCHVPAPRCQADHLTSWQDGGSTCPQNGAPACGKHNRHRNHGFTVERAPTGSLAVRRPDGTLIE